MDNLTKEDQETLITMDALDRSAWKVYTSDPVYITKLNKIAKPTRSDDWGNHYKLDSNQVRLFKPISDSTRAKNRLNGRKGLKKARALIR